MAQRAGLFNPLGCNISSRSSRVEYKVIFNTCLYAIIDNASWIYVNQKGKYECWSKGIAGEDYNLLNKYALATMKCDKEKFSTEIREAFYKYEKGLIFVLTSEFSTLAIVFRNCTDTKVAEENSMIMLAMLEEHLKAFSYSITLH